ncbi:MAG: hypothetical protein IJX52_00925 [Oscillibacter sp.]|nr:hypothetical protein [Oscillibacter sp.]
MLARNETIIKWALYAAVSLLWVFAQGAVLQRLEVFGVLPFVFPLLAAIPATYESPTAGTAFALGVGVFCDLLLPAPLPCFYTLIFTAVGLCAALLSQGVLSAGFLCSTAAAAIAFLLTGLFHCFLLWVEGKAAWALGLRTAALEALVTYPLVFPVTVMYRWVYRRTHLDD